MQDLDPPAIPFLFKVDAELRKSKFTVWRNISWHDGSEVPIFAFKNSWIPYPISISVFVRELDPVSVSDLKSFAQDCLKYVQRTVPKTTRSPWFRQYICIPVLIAEKHAP